MVAPVNEFDTRLQAETQRTLAPRGGIILSATANLVTVNGSIGTPSVITLVATPLVVSGSVVFSTSPTVPLTIDSTGLIATLRYADMGTSSIVVTATLTSNGIPYTDTRAISQVSIGSLGYQGALNATANNSAQGLLSARPAGADGDFYFATDALVLYQKVAGAWRAAGNNFTNTSQLTDGANLGGTAVWSGVSGTGRPQDGATVGAPAGTSVAGTLAETLVSTANAAKASAQAANDAIAIISDDGKLSKGEKSAVVGQWSAITGEYGALQAQAGALGIVNELNTYNTNYNTLANYLNGLTGWSDFSTDTPIDGPTFRSNFSTYYTAKQALLNAMAAAAATKASWVGVDGRPANIAALTGTEGINNVAAVFSPYKAWEFRNTFDGWTGSGVVLSSHVDSLQANASTNDPSLYSPALSVIGALYDRVRARVRRTAGSIWQGQVYYTTSGHGYSESYTKTIADATAGGAWTILEWDMSSLTAGGADWANSTITSVRLDLGSSSSDGFEIDWITIGKYGVPNLPDLGYTGDLNATYGATLGTNVGGQIDSGNSAALIAAQAISSTQISDLRTTNYAQDASGNPTAGAKLASTGTALKVANNSLQVGTLVFSDYWFRLVQGIDGSVTSNRLIWRGNNDATTRGGAPNISCLSVSPWYTTTDAVSGANNGNQTAYHTYALTPTSYAANSDNLDAIQQIHVQYFAQTTYTAPFTEVYQPCPSRTYDGATGVVQGTFMWLWNYNVNNVPPKSTGFLSTNRTSSQGVYSGYLRVRIANTYGWSATRDFDVGVTAGTPLTATTITGVAGSAGGGSGSSGGACPAPWVKVRLLNGKEVNAADLHNGARLAAVNDSTMQALPQGGVVRELATIWAQRYRVKLADGTATEWSENHRFAVAERGWVHVQHLRGGDQILGLRESIVDSVLAVGEGQVVSFRVEGAGTYFAGGLLCHNTKAAF